jgi:predicted HAD superfamily phosphohydrolase YqeG
MSLDVLRANYSHKLQKPKFSLQANITLPCCQKNAGKKTLVLDMDETLIHCSLNRKSPNDIEISMDKG